MQIHVSLNNINIKYHIFIQYYFHINSGLGKLLKQIKCQTDVLKGSEHDGHIFGTNIIVINCIIYK